MEILPELRSENGRTGGRTMTDQEKQIRELKEENARLHRQLLREKAIRYKLFTLVPPERLAELLRENPEQYQ